MRRCRLQSGHQSHFDQTDGMDQRELFRKSLGISDVLKVAR
jgi:hypothetical protein